MEDFEAALPARFTITRNAGSPATLDSRAAKTFASCGMTGPHPGGRGSLLMGFAKLLDQESYIKPLENGSEVLLLVASRLINDGSRLNSKLKHAFLAVIQLTLNAHELYVP